MMQFHGDPNPRPPTEEEAEAIERVNQRELNTPLPVFYIVATIAVVLILIVAFVGVNVFHFW
jgi:hypothetical protein